MGNKKDGLFSRRNRIIFKELVKTDYKMRYQGSVLGHVWDFLKPLMLFGVRFFIFAKLLGLGNGVKHFPISLFLGMIFLTFFQEATIKGMTSIVTRKSIIKKAQVPSVIIVLSAIMGAIINFVINLSVVLLFILMSGIPITINWLMIIPLFIELLLLSIGASLLLSTLYAKFKDVIHLWEIILQILTYATPIIYPMIRIVNYSRKVAMIMMINPLAQMVQDVRYAIIDTNNVTISQLSTNFIVSILPYILSPIIFILGFLVFQKHSKNFPEIL